MFKIIRKIKSKILGNPQKTILFSPYIKEYNLYDNRFKLWIANRIAKDWVSPLL